MHIQQWNSCIRKHNGFISPELWPLDSSDLNPIDYSRLPYELEVQKNNTVNIFYPQSNISRHAYLNTSAHVDRHQYHNNTNSHLQTEFTPVNKHHSHILNCVTTEHLSTCSLTHSRVLFNWSVFHIHNGLGKVRHRSPQENLWGLLRQDFSQAR